VRVGLPVMVGVAVWAKPCPDPKLKAKKTIKKDQIHRIKTSSTWNSLYYQWETKPLYSP
jgi:hypothetical protein